MAFFQINIKSSSNHIVNLTGKPVLLHKLRFLSLCHFRRQKKPNNSATGFQARSELQNILKFMGKGRNLDKRSDRKESISVGFVCFPPSLLDFSLLFKAVTKEMFEEALRALADDDFLTVTGKTVRLL